MQDPKYTKKISSYATNLLESGYNKYTITEYLSMLDKHKIVIEKHLEDFKKIYPTSFDHVISVAIGAEEGYYSGSPHLEYETKIEAKDFMSDKEIADAKQGEINRKRNEDLLERRKLAALLQKYPDFNLDDFKKSTEKI